MECYKVKCDRCVVVIVGCCILFASGLLGGLSATENDLKKLLSITQEQVELIISMTTFGFCLGLPAGLILERFGPKWASLLALIISVSGYTGFYLALVYPKGFGTSLFWLLVTSVFVAGLGVAQMFWNGVAVNSYNFEVHNRGRVIGLVASMYFIGVGFFSTLYEQAFGSAHLPAYALSSFSLIVLVNLVAIIMLKEIPQNQKDDIDEKKDKVKDTSNGQIAIQEENSNTEHEELIESGKKLLIVYYGEYNVYEAVKTIDFHLFCWPCIFSTSIAFMYSFSLPVFLKSFDLLHLQSLLISLGSTLAGLCKMSSGFVSDLTLTRFPRLLYLIIALLLQTSSLFLSILAGDQTVVVIFTVLIQFITLGIFMVMTPMIMCDWYGVTHYASIWGAIMALVGLGNFGMSYLMGALYDSEITDGSNTCYGLKCFRITFILSAIVSVVILVSLWILYKRQTKLLQPER